MSIGYLSPELMQNETCTSKTDMWALGCIFYELCTLKLPFHASSLLDLAYQVKGIFFTVNFFSSANLRISVEYLPKQRLH